MRARCLQRVADNKTPPIKALRCNPLKYLNTIQDTADTSAKGTVVSQQYDRSSIQAHAAQPKKDYCNMIDLPHSSDEAYHKNVLAKFEHHEKDVVRASG